MRLRKKILGLLIAIVGLGCFSSSIGIPTVSTVHAQEAITTKENTVVPTSQSSSDNPANSTASMEDNFRNLADIFLKVAYILLWPLVFLSGLALDNTMVYGAVFHMDAPLRQFRNLCKNFANFGLGFMILWSILQNIFALGSGKTKPIDTIKKAAIAGILIQLSWFIVAASIDVSTIATYAVGGIPMSILRTDSTLKNTKILQPNVNINFNNQNKISAKDFAVSYQVQGQDGKPLQFSRCRIAKSDTQQYIVGRESGDAAFRNQKKLNYIDPETKKDVTVPDDVNACIYLGQVKFFHEFPDIAQLTGTAYDTELNDILGYEERDGWEACGYVIKLGTSAPTTKTCSKAAFDNIDTGQDLTGAIRFNNPPTTAKPIAGDAGKSRFANSAATSIGNIISQSKGFVGPLATIYGSMMDMANLSDVSTTNGSAGKSIGELIIRVAVAGGLLFPLLALTVVLIIRIGFLRCIIGTSPIIILLKTFDIKIDALDKHINIKNIISAIFAPVITVLALSMSLLFMTALMSTYKSNDPSLNQGLESMGVTSTIGTTGDANDSIDIFGLVLKYPKTMNTWAGDTGNRFSWMIICSAGIGIMRFVLFAAIGASGTIGAVGKKIQEFGQNAMSTIQIPTPLGPMSTSQMKNNFTGDGLEKNLEGYRDNRVVHTDRQDKQMQDYLEQIGYVKPTPEHQEARVVEMITGKEKNYDLAIETMTGGKSKEEINANDIMLGLDNNKKVMAALATMNEEDRAAVFSGFKDTTILTQVNKKIADQTEKDFESGLGTTIADKKTLDEKLKAGDNIAKLDKNYTYSVKSTDGKTKYKISVDKDKNILQSDTGTPIRDTK